MDILSYYGIMKQVDFFTLFSYNSSTFYGRSQIDICFTLN